MAAYPRAHLDDLTRRRARGLIRSARYWRGEAGAPMCIFTARYCRTEARACLTEAADLRRQLIALRGISGRYVTPEHWAAIQKGA